MGHLIFGVIAVVSGLSGVFMWWEDFGRLVRGVVPLSLVVIGFVAIAAGLGARRKRREAVPELEPARVHVDPAFRAAAVSMERQPAP